MSQSSLPAVLVLTDRVAAAAAGHDLPGLVGGLEGLDVGVVLREKDLPGEERRRLAASVADAARRARVAFIVASDAALARSVAARGVHLAAADPTPEPIDDLWVGRSCHDEDELRQAATDGVDYVMVSPIHETASKPGYGPALGPDGLRRIASHATVPVYALGGLTTDRVAACLDAGAHGVAVMGTVMRAPDPTLAVTEILAAVHEHRLTRTTGRAGSEA